MSGPGDEITAAVGRGRGTLRASHADREHVIETLKAAFVQERLARDEFDLRVGQAFAARTHAELAAVTASLPAQPTTAKPPTSARTDIEPPVVRSGPLLAVATAMTLWLSGAVMVESWLKRRSGDRRARRVSL